MEITSALIDAVLRGDAASTQLGHLTSSAITGIIDRITFVGDILAPVRGIRITRLEDFVAGSGEDGLPAIVRRNSQNRPTEPSPLLVTAMERQGCEAKAGGAPTALVADEAGLDDAIAVITDAFARLQEWDSDLKDALIEDRPLDEMAAIGARLVRHPFAVIDKKLDVIALSPDYGAWTRSHADTIANGPLSQGERLPASAANELIEDEGYHRAASMTEPFYYPFDAPGQRYFGVNMFVSGEYVARLTVPLPLGADRLSPGEEELATHLASCLFAHMERHARSIGLQRGADDSMHALARSLIEEAYDPGLDEIGEALESYGWSPPDTLLAIELEFFEGPSWESAAPYLCSLLEKRWRDSVAIPRSGRISWLVNVSAGGEAFSREAFMRALAETITEYACKAGVSRTFTGLARLRAHHLQARAALEIGQRSRPHLWYHLFDDHALDYLLAHSCGDLEPEYVAHPGVLRLVEHDKAHGTEYARSLLAYLDADCNTTHAAQGLFIHRSSLLRRLERAGEIAGTDAFSLGPDEKLHILLTFRLLA